jgi:lysophospholipase L1-like esterase
MSDFMVQDGQTFLFQGDSITDCGRRDSAAPYGAGYAAIFRELAMALFPERGITFINKGIGGNTTVDLRERWDDDTLRHQPDWMSLLVGINDLHRYLFNPDTEGKISPQQFAEHYDWLLERVTKETPAKLILLEPFFISLSSCDTTRKLVLDVLPEYIQVVRDMSAKYSTLLVNMHDIYQAHLVYRDADHFCPEPVHPNHTGHLAMALELMRVLGGL